MLFVSTGFFDVFTESSALLLFALKRRRFYMSQSNHKLSSTAGLMLDGEGPPSTTFCLPQSSTGEVKLSFGGDVTDGGVCLYFCLYMCIYNSNKSKCVLGYGYKVMLQCVQDV